MKVYKYGLLPPIKNQTLVFEQLNKAYQYKKQLIDLVNQEKALLKKEEDNIFQRLNPALISKKETTQQTVEELLALMKQQRSKNRSKQDNIELKQQFKIAKENAKQAKKDYFTELSRIKTLEEVKTSKEKIKTNFKQLHKEARKKCGVYWGTYLLIEEAVEQSKKTSFKKDFIFYGRRDNERLGNQIQTSKDDSGSKIMGMLSSHLFNEKNSQIYIEPVADTAWIGVYRKDRRRTAKTILHWRIASDEKLKPIWAEFPMIMHRPLPKDSKIKSATISRRFYGPHQEWTLEITIDDNLSPTKELGNGVVALDIGWRKLNDKIRVATLYDGEFHKELVISTYQLDKANELKSLRDDLFNQVKNQITEWNKEKFPEWILKELEFVSKWKSQARLVRLVKNWKKERWQDDNIYFELVEAWRYKDQHLWQWECGSRRSGLRERIIIATLPPNLERNITVLYWKTLIFQRWQNYQNFRQKKI